MAPFYRWGSIASRLEPIRGGSLLFTTKFPEILGTHFIDLRRMKGWVSLGATQWFWKQDPRLGIQRINHRKTPALESLFNKVAHLEHLLWRTSANACFCPWAFCSFNARDTYLKSRDHTSDLSTQLESSHMNFKLCYDCVKISFLPERISKN